MSLKKKHSDPRLERMDDHRVRIVNPQGIDAVLFANEEVPVETAAVDELVGMLALSETAERFAERAPDAFDELPEVARVSITPDFHKARGIPVGTVLQTKGFFVPQAIGNDINCGMRLHVTSLTADAVREHKDELETAFRHRFFEGGRNIPMTYEQREGLFLGGLRGLHEATPKDLSEGLWALYQEVDQARELSHVEGQGSLQASQIFGLEDFLGTKGTLSRDAQIGSIGGGNHFVEIQQVKEILDGTVAHAWGLRPGMVTVMVHTGSLSVGHLGGGYFRDVLRAIYPEGLRHPDNGIFLLPEGARYKAEEALFWDVLHNAGNFAFANRMFLALIAVAGLRAVLGSFDFELLYDAPHNFLWREKDAEGRTTVLHRKGATPARGLTEMQGTPFAFYGEPVLVPGSMGSSSFILAGEGNGESLQSASHGAGRALSRGAALKGNDEEFRRFLEEFRVVTPLDLRRADVRARRDIVEKKLEDIKQEAPHAYKGIGPIIQTLAGAQLARPVAELEPLMTIKA